MSFFTRKQPDQALPNRRNQPGRPERESATSNYAFRRNRTLTGSTSSKIDSSNELRADLSSPRAHAHHLTRTRRKIAGLFIGALIVIGGLYFALTQFVATSAISVASIGPIPASEADRYSKTIDRYYATRPAERFIGLLDREMLLAYLQTSHPEIKNVRLEPSGQFGRALVTLTAREPIARWSISGGREYVDTDGVVFSVNYFATPELRIVDNSGLSQQQRVLTSNRFLGFVGQIAGLSQAQGYALSRATIPAQTTRQVELRVKGRPERYLVSVDRSAEEQAIDIARVAGYLTDEDKRYDYVDLRIAGKAYYK